ncbi:MAG: hypothetical protein J6D31_07250 [Clostridia bacterium]|nr:hypothetical protein [Clostridia bacterium]
MGDERTLPKYIKALRGKWALLLLAAAGVLLLLLGGGQPAAQAAPDSSEEAARTEAYRAALTEELCTLCSRVRGAGRVELVLTLSGGEETVYATDVGQDGRTDYVLSGGEGLLLYRKPPAVLGVGVVCDGGGDPAVCHELTALLSATLGIGSNRIYITCT